MSLCRKFASLAHSKEFGYAYDSQAWDMKAPMDQHFRMFHTYGDGLCQHSGDWSVTVEHITDYLASLATVMLVDDELTDSVKFVLSHRPRVSAIEFAASVIWKDDGKRRYYSVQEEKVSSSPAKQHDKRYQDITDVHNGTPESIFRILIPEHTHGMDRYCYASAIRDWLMEKSDRGYMSLPAEFLKWFPGDHDKGMRLRDAYDACWSLIQANQLRHTAVCALGNYTRTLEPRILLEPKPATESAA